MKKYMKMISAIFIVLMILVISNQAYAVECSRCGGDGLIGGFIECSKCDGDGIIVETIHSTDDIISGADSFIEIGEAEDEKIAEEDLQKLSNTIYNILLVVGIAATVIVGLIMGIKFMLGSLEEKAEIKAMLIPYIIGCIVIFGAFTIWKIVVNILQSV